MKILSGNTRLYPDKRIEKLLKFNQRLSQAPESVAVLREWNFQLDHKLVKVNGRVLKHEHILFNGST